jgi:flavin reductase (DIM6/NTAB) family NADH-FMN oxidoreductase RutF
MKQQVSARSSALPPPPHLLPVSRDAYVAGMRQIAGTVGVVTTDGPLGRVGATVTAFCSVSADPPALLVCLRSASRICEAVKANRTFTLNILKEDDHAIARVFAGEFDASRADRFQGVALVEHQGLSPSIRGALSFACRTARTEVQDSHTLFIGRVLDVAPTALMPLTYHDGRYGGVRGGPPDTAVNDGAPASAECGHGSK